MRGLVMIGLRLLRDWTVATPKFLAATYVRPKAQTASPDGRRYGGFIVRVVFRRPVTG